MPDSPWPASEPANHVLRAHGRAPTGWPGQARPWLRCETASLLRRLQSRFGVAARRFDLGGFFLAKLDDVIEQLFIVEAIGGLAVEIDHAMTLAGAAAGESEIGLARLA